MARFATLHDALREAVQIAGGQSALARIVGCTQGNISLLLKLRKPLTSKYVLKAEAATGVSRHDLNPGTFGIAVDDLPTLPPISTIDPAQ